MQNFRALAAVLAIALMLLPQTVLAPATKIVVGPNFRVTQDTNNQPQVEPSIAIDPRNPKIIAAGANDMRLFEGQFLPSGWAGFYRSTDSGKTWTNTLVPGFPGDNSPQGLSSPLKGFQFFFDAVLRFDSQGNLFYGGIVFTQTPTFGQIMNGTYFVAKYVSDGTTFKSTAIVTRGTAEAPFADKPFLFVNPANDNIYATWTDFKGASTDMAFSRSTDHGVTFSSPLILTTSSLTTHQGMENSGQFSYIAAINNIVYVAWIQSAFAPFTTNIIHRLLLVRSIDGGLGFSSPVEIARITPIPGALPGNLYRASSFPAIVTDSTGQGLFVAWADFSTGNAEILSIFSNNGGRTFSAPLRVNDATINNHFNPFVGFSGGRLHIAWYDSRLNLNGKLLDVFYTTSSDFGKTFAPNVRVTSQSFDPNRLIYINLTRAFIGDYIWVDASGRTVQVAWSDNRDVISGAGFNTGARNSDIFTARITLT